MASKPATEPATAEGVTILGTGAMGSALAGELLGAGHPVTVWNRTAERAVPLATRGAAQAETPGQAVIAHPLVVMCLLRAGSVHDTLTPVAAELRGRTLLNVTTTTPNESRELARWAADHDVTYLDGAILAVPEMIGSPAAQIFYSGSREAYDRFRDVLDVWSNGTYDGDDAGAASLIDLALLSGMYQMFAGFFHGAAMAGFADLSATEFAARAAPFLAAMTEGFADFAGVIDGGDYAVPGQQSLEFSDLSHIVRASEEQGVDPAPVATVQELISRQIAAGHGSEGFPRVYESLRRPAAQA
ncbi:NAD(P)-binding domain-containing protein [Prauserella halophila]|uniref:NAD(P)-binding domain-containing protein n=1 Tax=Prauserella halophila TaxID=185641 RepID=A0ABP4H580_9PSEU|nr:NAD(P)-binding domain-containing protein [Prauserella halophila]MCP2236627.1 3-hydroxyisobutyrate dehydrogenase [Prauserella halophila]